MMREGWGGLIEPAKAVIGTLLGGLMIAIAVLALGTSLGWAKAPEFGPYAATVVRVIDADTLELDVATWPGQTIAVGVRLDGVDTPETHRPDCGAEREIGERATAFVRELAPPGSAVILSGVREGKYAGRVIGTIVASGPRGPVDLAAALVGADLARPYDGGTRPEWCDGR